MRHVTAYGIVWKAIDRKSGEVVAVKKILDAFQNATDAQRTYCEIMFLQEFGDHSNIIRLRNVIRAENDKDIYLIFEFMETDLHNVIKRGNILSDVHKQYIMYQLFTATKYIHSGNVIHRDYKPSNVLLDNQCSVKVCDFGLARSLCQMTVDDQGDPNLTEYVATRWYRAPEILLASHRYTKGVDMWSLGCILGEMLSGKPLFPGSSTLNQIERIIATIDLPTEYDVESIQSAYGPSLLEKAAGRPRVPLNELMHDVSKNALDLLHGLLQFNPDKRLTAEQALKHPYVRQFHSPLKEVVIGRTILPPISDDVQLSTEECRSKLYEMVAQAKVERRRRHQAEHDQKQVIEKDDVVEEAANDESHPENIPSPSEPRKRVHAAANRTAVHDVPVDNRSRDVERKESTSQPEGKTETRPIHSVQKVTHSVVAFGRTTMQPTTQNPIRAKSQYHSRQKPVDTMTKNTHHQATGGVKVPYRQVSAPAGGQGQLLTRPHSVIFSRQAANPVILRDMDKQPMLGVTNNRIEASVIVLDVGRGMTEAPSGEKSLLQLSLDAISLILEQKIFVDSKDRLSLVLFGTPNTANKLASEDGYQNIMVAQPLGPIDWNFLKYVQNYVSSSAISTDFIDALVVAMDHLSEAIKDDKGFEASSKRVILFSNLSGEFGDDQLHDIMASFKESYFELIIIGPDLAGKDDAEKDDGVMKTPQQKAGENILRYICENVAGVSYEFSEIFQALSHILSCDVLSSVWKAYLVMGSSLKIPVCVSTRAKEAKAKNVSSKDTWSSFKCLRTNNLNDNELIVQQSSENDKEAMKYEREFCFVTLGFTKSENVKLYQVTGDPTWICTAEQGGKASAAAFSEIINVLCETHMVVVVRRAFSGNEAAKVGCLIPKCKCELLFYVEFPFCTDLETLPFVWFPVDIKIVDVNKFISSDERLCLMTLIDQLKTIMTHSSADKDTDEDEPAAKSTAVCGQSSGLHNFPKPKVNEKIFIVIDTNLFLNDWGKDILNLKDWLQKQFPPDFVRLVIPWMVLQELDRIKDCRLAKKTKNSASLRHNNCYPLQERAKKAVKQIQQWLRNHDPLVITENPRDSAQKIENRFKVENNDDHILNCCLLLQEKHYGSQVALLTLDNNLLNKSMALSINAFTKKTLYSWLNNYKPGISADLEPRSSSATNSQALSAPELFGQMTELMSFYCKQCSTEGNDVKTCETSPVWIPDVEANVCMHCRKSEFSVLNRRHHCRSCGIVCCSSCSDKRWLLPHQSQKPLRVCLTCFNKLTIQTLERIPLGVSSSVPSVEDLGQEKFSEPPTFFNP